MAGNGAAKELIKIAKNRMQKFYNPKMYKAPPKTELSTEDRIYVNNGGTLTTEAPGGIAGTGVMALVEVGAHVQRAGGAAAPPPPPRDLRPVHEEGPGEQRRDD